MLLLTVTFTSALARELLTGTALASTSVPHCQLMWKGLKNISPTLKNISAGWQLGEEHHPSSRASTFNFCERDRRTSVPHRRTSVFTGRLPGDEHHPSNPAYEYGDGQTNVNPNAEEHQRPHPADLALLDVITPCAAGQKHEVPTEEHLRHFVDRASRT